jgi:hypothetical protein
VAAAGGPSWGWADARDRDSCQTQLPSPAPSRWLPHRLRLNRHGLRRAQTWIHRLTSSVQPYFTRDDGACVKGCRWSLHNGAMPWQAASARSLALHGSVWLTLNQLSPTCCKIVSTTIQCTIDNAEKTTAAVAPGGAQAAIWTLIASSFQTFPQQGMQIANFIPISELCNDRFSTSRRCGSALTS